jgi:hypothetical protein
MDDHTFAHPLDTVIVTVCHRQNFIRQDTDQCPRRGTVFHCAPYEAVEVNHLSVSQVLASGKDEM